MGERADTGALVAGGVALVAVVCCAIGPAMLVGVVATLLAGVVFDSVALVVMAVCLASVVVIVRRRRAPRASRSTD